VILDDIASARLPRRQPTHWGELREGDLLVCPYDGEVEVVTDAEAGERGRCHVEAGDPVEGPRHTHTRPASDVVAVPDQAGDA
jgi:hypothetical protein